MNAAKDEELTSSINYWERNSLLVHCVVFWGKKKEKVINKKSQQTGLFLERKWWCHVNLTWWKENTGNKNLVWNILGPLHIFIPEYYFILLILDTAQFPSFVSATVSRPHSTALSPCQRSRNAAVVWWSNAAASARTVVGNIDNLLKTTPSNQTTELISWGRQNHAWMPKKSPIIVTVTHEQSLIIVTVTHEQTLIIVTVTHEQLPFWCTLVHHH